MAEISKEILAHLNHTDNAALREHRKQWNNHFVSMMSKELMHRMHKRILGCIVGNDITLSYQRRSSLDKQWLIIILNDYRENLRLSDGHGRKTPFREGTCLWSLDEKIVRAIFALNSQGITTSFSCEGGKENGHSYSTYILLAYNQKFPQSLVDKISGLHCELKEPPQDNPYRHGQSLHARRTQEKTMNESNSELLLALNSWADEQGVADIKTLATQWRNS